MASALSRWQRFLPKRLSAAGFASNDQRDNLIASFSSSLEAEAGDEIFVSYYETDYTESNRRHKMVLPGTSWPAVHFALYLPHIIFFLYKIGQSMFSPTTKLYLYASVCIDHYSYDRAATVARSTPSTAYGYSDPRLRWSVLSNYSIHVPNTFEETTLFPDNWTNCQALTDKEEDENQKEAADYIMAMKILQDVPAFILGLFCGGWSDRVGRRLPMMLPCIGGIIVSFMFICIQVGGGIALPGILFGIALNSFSGRNTLVSMAIQAYITDQSSEHERTRQLGRILAMNFFGLFAGSFLMALLADRVSFWVVFLFVAIFYSASLALIAFALPESKIPGHPGPGTAKRPSTSSSSSFSPQETTQATDKWNEMPACSKLFSCFRLDNFTDTMNTITRYRPNNMRRYLIVAYICIVLHNMCKSGEIDVLLLFVKHKPLSWTKSGYGYLLSFQYANVGLFLIFVLPFLLNVLQLSDSSIIIGCVITKAFGLSILAFSNRSWMVFVANVFVSTFGMIISCLRSIVSKMVDEDESGRCFAIISSSETVSDLIGVVFFIRLYYIGLDYPNGRPLPFIVMAFIHVILLVLAIYISIGLKRLSGAIVTGGYDTLDEELPETESTPRPSSYAGNGNIPSNAATFFDDRSQGPPDQFGQPHQPIFDGSAHGSYGTVQHQLPASNRPTADSSRNFY